MQRSFISSGIIIVGVLIICYHITNYPKAQWLSTPPFHLLSQFLRIRIWAWFSGPVWPGSLNGHHQGYSQYKAQLNEFLCPFIFLLQNSVSSGCKTESQFFSLAVNKKACSFLDLGFSIGKLATKAASLIRENKPIKPERDNNDVTKSFSKPNLRSDIAFTLHVSFSSLDAEPGKASLKEAGHTRIRNARRQGSSQKATYDDWKFINILAVSP